MASQPQAFQWFSFSQLGLEIEYPSRLDNKYQGERFYAARGSFFAASGYRYINSLPTENLPTGDEIAKALLEAFSAATGLNVTEREREAARLSATYVLAHWDPRFALRMIQSGRKGRTYTDEELAGTDDLSFRKAALALGCSASTIQAWRKRRDGESPAEAREHRLSRYASQIQALRREAVAAPSRAGVTALWLKEARKAKASMKYDLPPMKFTDGPPMAPRLVDYSYLLDV